MEQPTKECFKCHEVKPLSSFYKHAKMSDGHLNKCKDCTRLDVKLHRLANPETVHASDKRRNKKPERKEKLAERQKRYREKNPEKYKARTTVGNALRDGRLEKGPCEKCGTTERVQAHHDDYSKPLEVRWLCKFCHDFLHDNES